MDDEVEDQEPARGPLALHGVPGDLLASVGAAILSLSAEGAAGTIVGALAGPLLALSVKLDVLAADRAQRALAGGAERAGITPEALVAWAEADERNAGLLIDVVEAARRARQEQRVEVLARILAEGVTDVADVDVLGLITQTWNVLDRAHIEVLGVVKDLPVGQVSDRPLWDAEMISTQLPHLREGISALLAALTGRGCIALDTAARFGDTPNIYSPTDFGRRCLSYLEDRASTGPGGTGRPHA